MPPLPPARPSAARVGLTMLEVLLVVAVTLAVASAALPFAVAWRSSGELSAEASALAQAIRRARALSVGRVADQPHGVYLDVNPGGADGYVVFRGASYAARDPAADEVTTLAEALSLTSTVPGNEVVFSRGLGAPSATGTATLTHGGGAARTVTVVASGLVEVN